VRVRVYRICRAAHRALDGEGARRYGGRWTEPGLPVVYTSTTRALAALEVLVHLDPVEAPRDLVLLTIEVPDDLTMTTVAPDELPPKWAEVAEPPACQARGGAWARGRTHVALRVPAAPVPEEENVLLNPAHRDYSRVAVVAERPFRFDPRLRG
jgi:RES domain-containing protein